MHQRPTRLRQNTNNTSYVITPNFWPYAVRIEDEVQNHAPQSQTGLITIAAFVNMNKIPGISHLYTFGCPADV